MENETKEVNLDRPAIPPTPIPLQAPIGEVPMDAATPMALPPRYAKQWNWGAFLLSLFWAGAMRL